MAAPKVVHLTSAHPRYDIRIFRKQCRTLAASGYDVVLVMQEDHDETVDGVRIRAVPRPRNRFERMTRTAWQVVRIAAVEKAQIYHLHDPELLFWTLPLRLRGGRIVFDMHEDMPKSILSKVWLPPWARGILSWLTRIGERALLTGVPVVFAETSYQWDRPWVKRSTTVLNMAIADELLAIEETKHDEFTACYMGTVTPDRGALTMIDAMGILEGRGRRLALECIGPMPPQVREEVTERARNVTLPVRISGQRLYPEEAWRLTARGHVGLAVLKGIPNNYAIQPTKFFEYMALGMPVIASNYPTYRAVIEKASCGICVDPESAHAVADAIEWLMDHPDEVGEMGERGREAVIREFNWKVEAKKLLRLYEELITPTQGDAPPQQAQA